MKNRFVRIVTGLLFACMVAGSVPVEAVYGIENNVENGQDEEQSLPENRENIGNLPDDANASDEERINEDQGDGNNQHSNQQSSSESSKEVADSLQVDEADGLTEAVNETLSEDEGESTIIEGGEKISAGEIDYVYIESPYLQTPGTQRIVFSFGQQITGVDTISLTVEDEAGNQEDWELSEQTENLYLFEKAYTGDAYSGTYHAVSLNLSGEDEKMIMLDEVGIEAEFGVNQEYEGIEELEPLDETATEEEIAQVGASVVTIDENGVVEAQDSIADALNAVSASTSAGTSTFSASARSASTRSKNFIVALDPGHDANDAGASANGLREEVLTLKIANYCKKELEQYNGVTVIMTRTGAACPCNCTSAGSCIRQRVQWAVNQGAQVFISFHLNASTSSSANGAEVIVPNYSWKPALGTAGRQLAEKILDELEDLGLTRRSIYSKNTTVGEKYEDGSISDYFSVQIYCKENDIPGIIVEHAFITNSSDVNNYLKTDAGLKSLGVADATGIAKYLGLSKGYWSGDYYYVNGQPVKGEYCIGGKWYYFDESTGRLKLGFQTVGSRTVYYTRENGMAFGECLIDGKWYYFSEANGNLQLGFQTVGTRTIYYTREDGMLFGEQCIDGKWYYFDANNGNVKLGFQKVGSRTVYYTLEDGMLFGKQEIDGKQYWFDEKNGNVKLGFQEVDGKTVYFTLEDGMISGEYCIDGKWLYFDNLTGELLLGFQTVGTRTVYYTKEEGMLFGEQCIDGKWYYFDANNGNVKLGFQKVGSRTVYYTLKDGMLFGLHTIDGKRYLFNENNGNIKLGLQVINGETYYFTQEDGMIYGEQCIDDKWYYFDKLTGKLLLGFQTVGTRTVYYTKEEGMLFGEHCINGKWYYFNNNGNLQLGFQKVGSRTVYYTQSDGMIFGPYTIDGKNYYFSESNGNMARSEWVNGKYYDENGVESVESQIPIMGTSQTTVTQMVNYYRLSGATYPEFYKNSDAPTLEDFCTIYYEEAKAQGIRAEVAFTQAMKETGWLRYGGDVKIEQYNFAGLGAVGSGANGASFSNVREGVRAQIQHLFAYASTEGESGLVYPCVDGRFNLVSPKGGAPYVEWLGKQENPTPGYGWATAANYGVDIALMVNNLLKCSK